MTDAGPDRVVQIPDGFAETLDLRSGAPISERLLAVLPLVGRWRGFGSGSKPATGEPFRYAQELSFSHDGRPFLAYESRTWLVDADDVVIRPALREAGFVRPGSGEDDLELVLALATGLVEVFSGVAGDRRWELVADAVGRTPTAAEVAGERRLYALLSDDQLGYVQELERTPGAYQPHLNAQLERN